VSTRPTSSDEAAGPTESAEGEPTASWDHVQSALLQVTFDQLRTFLALHETRSPARAAAALRRDQSSVTKQLETLNTHFRALCGEPLARRHPRQRGRDLTFTRSGELVATLAASLFDEWSSELHRRRLALGGSLSVGATAFILDFVPEAWNHVVRSLTQRGVQLSIRQIRTRHVLSVLHERSVDVDVVLGGVILERDAEGIDDPQLDFLPWDRQPFVLLTNYPTELLPDSPVSPEMLLELSLLLPGRGIIDDFLARWYGNDYKTRLRTYEIVGDVPFNLSLLRSGSIEACMIVPAFLADPRYLGNLRWLPLTAPDAPDLEAVASLVVRKADRVDRSPDNPLNVVWRLFWERAEASRRSSGGLT
jgi:DNA-binding transcriptional LysR family regulator